MNAVIGTGSTQDTVCEDGAHGYFTGDLDTLPEPLLYREPISGQPAKKVLDSIGELICID